MRRGGYIAGVKGRLTDWKIGRDKIVNRMLTFDCNWPI